MPSRYVTVRARHFLASRLNVENEPDVWLVNAKLCDDAGASLFDPVTGGLKVTVVSGGSSGGGLPSDVNVTDRPGRVLGRVGVDLLTDAVGLATDAGLASVYGRLADGSVRVGGTVAVSGPATDAQLRATPLPVSGPLTDAQLRASSLPVSIAALPLPAGAATQATLATLATDAGLASVFARLADGSQHTVVDSSALPAGASTSALQTPGNASVASIDAKTPALVTGRVPVDGSGVTQPISAAALPLPAGASTEATLAAIKAKTDNLDVALSTRAITGLTDAQLRASAVPVSGPLTDAQLRASAVAISAAALPLPAGAAQEHTTAASPHACRLSDGAAFYDGAKTGQLPAALVGGRLDGNIGAWLGSTAPTVGAKTSANSIPVVVASDQAALPVTAPTITKGTQGANGFTTQDLKDAGRARVSIVFQGTGAVADALLSLVKSTNGVAATGATTIPVAANKRLRITSMTFSVKANAAAAAFATFTLRINPAGAAIITSQSELRVDLGNTEAVAGAARAITIPFPDGFELSGTDQLAVSAAAQATTNILSVSLNGFEY
jgi:hypothetical protein